MKQRSLANEKRCRFLNIEDDEKRLSCASCILAECRYLVGVFLVTLAILLNKISKQIHKSYSPNTIPMKAQTNLLLKSNIKLPYFVIYNIVKTKK